MRDIKFQNYCRRSGNGAQPKSAEGTDNYWPTRTTRAHTVRVSMEFLQDHGMEKAPQPPYSPHLAPSDFDLFDHVKQWLSGYLFADAGRLLQAIPVLLNGIEKCCCPVSLHRPGEGPSNFRSSIIAQSSSCD
jgi:hypothetical protein